jgi:hypothetical protein
VDFTAADTFRLGLWFGLGAAVGWTVVTVGRKSLGLAVLAVGMAAIGLGRWAGWAARGLAVAKEERPGIEPGNRTGISSGDHRS